MEEKIVNEEKTENKDTKALVKKILVIAGNVVFYAIIIVLFLFSLMNINAGNGTENFPNLFGKGMLNVMTDSMERDEKGYYYSEWDSLPAIRTKLHTEKERIWKNGSPSVVIKSSVKSFIRPIYAKLHKVKSTADTSVG